MATTTNAVGVQQPTTPRLRLRHVSLVLVVVGIVITSYLTYTKLFNIPQVCLQGGMFNCAVVENSSYATWNGIPIALFGLIWHLLIGAVLLLENRVPLLKQYGIMIILGLTLFGVIYHSFLIYVSFFRLQALCSWCLAAATTMYLQFIVTSLRLRNVLKAQA